MNSLIGDFLNLSGPRTGICIWIRNKKTIYCIWSSTYRPSIASLLTTNSSPSDQRLARFTIQQFPTRPLVNQRLREVEMKNWTGVSIDNDLAASIISFYIEIDYQTLPLFNLDLFLEDLIRNRPYFCSSLLVNALFSWACVSQPSQREKKDVQPTTMQRN